ncbi:serine aminopeptidase domain-containing protein [Facklamia sp. 7083-14-GEN3]|uniref:serine aminopeptidase domain-containing protein n=1 Tax=Facklamia sp. 7083-14-GEN3 TaxID=2973478 RepID=UPI00215BC69F|nr:alpha/beta hydrolase [Facklamia sp. 7083-14-GEN3]MCR8968776.1 alpha/beta hydrolase [Facklamia sp. 7083-14-GEN3]
MKVLVSDFVIEDGPFGPIPGRILCPSDKVDQTLPLVFFYHGWTNSAGEHLHFGMEIARQGFRVIMPDAFLHGKRGDKLSLESQGFLLALRANIEEFPLLIDYFKPTIEGGFVAVSGMSMGAITTLLLLSRHPFISAAVSLMGSAYISKMIDRNVLNNQQLSNQNLTNNQLLEQVQKEFAIIYQLDLSKQAEKIANRPLYIWHGENDPLVPFRDTVDFVESIANQPFSQNTYFNHEPSYHQVPFKEIVKMANFLKAASTKESNQIWEYVEKTSSERKDFFE